jgi:formamidopyrimidine-DNA glycosylase
MPELPDVTVYVERLQAMVVGHVLERVRMKSPFLLRSVEPPLSELSGRRLERCARMGKRLVFSFEGDLHLVLHLMIAGRLRLRTRGAGLPGKMGLAAFDFDHGTLLLTEAGTKKRASLHVVAGADGLAAHDPGGLEPLDASAEDFAAALRTENHTLKRALTDPRLLSGIGNAYSDEILHRGRFSPFKRTADLSDDEAERLRAAVVATLEDWTDRTRDEVGDAFPDKVTAFREGMAVHGRHGEPCPDCGAPVQRIVYAENECNYCAPCQTGGKLLADRALSRLLKQDWPRTLEELEELKRR